MGIERWSIYSADAFKQEEAMRGLAKARVTFDEVEHDIFMLGVLAIFIVAELRECPTFIEAICFEPFEKGLVAPAPAKDVTLPRRNRASVC